MKHLLLSVLLISLVGLSIPSAFAESVPEWVKNTAGWWATDAISETEFVNAIEFLVKENIIQVNVTETSGTSQGVPDWIKNNAGWWASGQIDDQTFILGLEWLLTNGIIVVEKNLIQTDSDFRVAFIGDQGNTMQSIAVLNLIKDEGAQMVLHQGDFDYRDNPDGWDKMISDVLGSDFPYFASIGHHDELKWNDYQEKLYDRLKKNPDVECIGDLGVKSSCTYNGLFFILVGPGIMGSSHSSFIEEQLDSNNHIWRICSWAQNMHYIQTGIKPDNVGWEVYENCKNGGAIIATAHEHVYSRTKSLINIENQIVDYRWPEPDKLRVKEGSTFVFVSGLGGKSIRDQNRCLPDSYPYGCNEEWAKIYTSTQAAKFGALFCTFNVDGQPNNAECYFKNIHGEVVDEFTVTSFIGIEDVDSNLYEIDLSDKDLSNRDLTGMTLVDIDFTDVNLTGAKLARADLSLSNLAGADLSGKDLTGTKLRAADLTGVNLDGTILTGTNFSNSILTSVDLSGKDLTGDNISNADIVDSDLSNAILVNADLTDAVFIRTQLVEADLTDANLTGADLSGMDLTKTKLREADLTDANLTGADLTGVNLDGTILTGTNFSNSILTSVDLSGKDLTGVKLRSMDMSNHDLTGAILVKADLTNAVLPNSYLINNNFTGTIFDGADLSGKDLSESYFNSASFVNTDMENITTVATVFIEVDFTKIKNKSLAGIDAIYSSFAYSNLSGVNLDDSNFSFINFQYTDLTDQDFTNNVTLVGSDLLEATLLNANFEGVNLGFVEGSVTYENQAHVVQEYMDSPEKLRPIVEDELLQIPESTKQIIVILSVHIRGDDVIIKIGRINNFANANLENANFKNADVRYAVFHGANLTNVDFTGADLSHADLRGATLEGAKLGCFNHTICK